MLCHLLPRVCGLLSFAQVRGIQVCTGIKLKFHRETLRCAAGGGDEPVGPLGPLGYECAQHRQTRRPSVDGIRSKALRPARVEGR